MRNYLERLEQRGELLITDRPVSARHELAADTEKVQRTVNKPILFTNVSDTRLPVVTNLYGSRERLAEILGIGPREFCRKWSELIGVAQAKDPPKVTVPAAADLVDLRLSDLPLLRYSERDGGAYFTSALFIPNERRPEGPFGEFMGYYVPVGDNAVFEVLGVSARPDAVFHSINCGSSEEVLTLELSVAASIYQRVSAVLPGIVDVTCLPFVLQSVVQIRQQYEGHARQVLLSVFRIIEGAARGAVPAGRAVCRAPLHTVFASRGPNQGAHR